jgi:hypothetical protein
VPERGNMRAVPRIEMFGVVGHPLIWMSFLVLLKDGLLVIIECGSREIFDIARELDAGICGVFEDRAPAEEFVARNGLDSPPPA